MAANKAKAKKEQDKQEEAPAPSGHNLPEADFLHHHKSMLEKDKANKKAGKDKNAANGEYRTARKLAKEAGVDLDAYDLARKLADGDFDETRMMLGKVVLYLSMMKCGISECLVMVDPEQGLDTVEVATRRGREAAAAEEECKPPSHYVPGTDLFNAWIKGWQQQTTEHAEAAKKK